MFCRNSDEEIATGRIPPLLSPLLYHLSIYNSIYIEYIYKEYCVFFVYV